MGRTESSKCPATISSNLSSHFTCCSCESAEIRGVGVSVHIWSIILYSSYMYIVPSLYWVCWLPHTVYICVCYSNQCGWVGGWMSGKACSVYVCGNSHSVYMCVWHVILGIASCYSWNDSMTWLVDPQCEGVQSCVNNNIRPEETCSILHTVATVLKDSCPIVCINIIHSPVQSLV